MFFQLFFKKVWFCTGNKVIFSFPIRQCLLRRAEFVDREISDFKLTVKCALHSKATQPWDFWEFIVSFSFMCCLWLTFLFLKLQCQGWFMSAIFCVILCSNSWQIPSLSKGMYSSLLGTKEAHNPWISLKRQFFLKGQMQIPSHNNSSRNYL